MFFTHRFFPLFVTQFLGAFNDNLVKNALIIMITFQLAHISAAQAASLVTFAGALFILPFFLFSATAGRLADAFDRAAIARVVKLCEIALAGLAAVGFYAQSVPMLLLVIFLFGLHSTFFGPIKYALLPQHLREDELVAGNGYIEAGTFLAILLGTILGGLLIATEQGAHAIALAMILCAVVGYVASRKIPPAPTGGDAFHAHWNIAALTWKMVRGDARNPHVWPAIIGISWFWLLGSVILAQLPVFSKETLHAGEHTVTLFLTLFSLGIGVGSLLCAKLLKGQINTRYGALCLLVISACCVDLFLAREVWRAGVDFFLIAAAGGMYVVPLYAHMQHESAPERRARTIASNNVMNALFMVCGALAVMALLALGVAVHALFLVLALVNLAAVVRFKTLA